MKVIVAEIPRHGLSLDEVQPAAELDLEGQGIRFKQPVHLHADVQRDEASVEIDLAIDTLLAYACDRCLQPVEQILTRQLHIVRPAKGEKVIDITQIGREEIILAYPDKRLCKPACKGLCPHCGRNMNNLSCACGARGEESPFRGVWLQKEKEPGEE